MPRTALAYLPLPAPLRRVESRPRTRRWHLSPFSRQPRVQPKPRQGVKNRAPRYAPNLAFKTHANAPGIIPVADEAVVECSVAAKGAAPRVAAEFPAGSFSISNWSNYPAGIPRPAGPFRLLEGEELAAARKAANNANRALHRADPALKSFELHEIQTVKFGGSPTDPLNKIPLTPTQHTTVSSWWYKLQRSLEGK